MPVEVHDVGTQGVMADLGRAALVVTLGLALYALVAGGYAAHTNRRRLADSARNALVCAFGSTLVAALVLLAALARHDFSFQYVAAHTNRTLSTGYALSALWAGQEGSLLLWLLILTGYGALAVFVNRTLLRDLVAWVVPVLGGVASFFAFVLVAVASPFKTQVPPVDGAGLTASLQNPYMVAHPPMLYLGYVGLAVPFAFAAGALLSGRTDERWIVATRRWTLAAWTFLGFGQILGAHWAYVEVGWGGYYAWDPVENAALMPWLAATAFLHSVMIQERKGMLKVWNVVLVALAFELSVFGTFLTRSDVVNSIHSFAKSPIGGWFLAFVVISSLFSLALILLRLPLLKARTKLESALSREATFLYNNLLLVALCLTVLWGVLFPVLTQLVKGETRTIGRPYYDFFLRAFGLPLLLLMGIGPLIAWRRTSVRALLRTLAWPIGVSVVCGAALVLAGAGSSRPGLIAYTFSAFVLATIVVEVVRGTRAVGSVFTLVARNRRRYGGYVVHAAVVLLAIGIAGSSAYGRSTEQRLLPGQTMRFDGYRLTYRGVTRVNTPQALETRAHLDVSGRWNGSIATGTNDYKFPPEPNKKVAIETDWLRGEDLYVIADIRNSGAVYFTVLVKPLVNLIWLAGIVFVLGSLVAMWPDAREQRRLVTRLAPARASA
ncbi:MAG TPA: cytochrome c-type biogenesis CcmF C-terminal domain-containing protein [Gaiellaceae bacterium]|nr:cytochrome c-type biogenesis CcmF C-terminal domain-containing protein [Gaiellaceae bacterium]